MTNPEQYQFFVSCAPGLESVLSLEYHQLGLTRTKNKKENSTDQKLVHEESGGMEFEGSLEQIMLANLHLHSANRVIVRLGSFYAAAFSELRKKASRFPWEKFIVNGQSVDIKVTCHKSRLYHSDAVAERVLGAINDHFEILGKHYKETTLSEKSQLILVRIVNDLCTISVDSSGEPLYKRGYKQAVAKAPLRENLAAALILSSGWDKTSPLIDPFCGSGTIPIEAALIARNIAPGLARSFQFQKWPGFENSIWEHLQDEARKSIVPLNPKIMGFDRDTGAIDMALANSARAGQKDLIQYSSQAISYLQPTEEKGWLITNPPYGIRIHENKDLRDLYARFGTILKERFIGWHTNILSNDDQLISNLSLGDPEKTIHFSNGGIDVKFVKYTINP